MDTKDVYQSKDVISFYKESQELQAPEKIVLEQFKSQLSKFKMLDIGIGCGRTTFYFSDKVKEYIGIDYSSPMIDFCKQKYAHLANNQFYTQDVRDLSQFSENYFDLILFSFNGIDYISHEERQSVLKEINRIGKKGSYFIFSSHNLQSINNLYKIQWSLSYMTTINSILYYLSLLYYNGLPTKYKKRLYSIINDGAHNFRLNTYYIKPNYQIELLEGNSFSNIRLLSLKDGSILTNELIDRVTDAWCTYVCNNSK